MQRLLFGLLLSGLLTSAALAEAPVRVVLSAPGPRNLSYLPVDLIPKIGADTAEGLRLQILHVGGGGVALANLANRNADFIVAGEPAQMSAKLNGADVVTIAAVNDAPLFVLMVRADLRNKVKRVADLRGRSLGVNSSTKGAKTTSQQLLEVVLKSDGVKPGEVSIVSAGQSWEAQSSVLTSRVVDAVMGDEPFATRLREAKQVFFLVNLGERDGAAPVAKVPGGHFLHAALATRSDVIVKSPELVEKMVRALRRSLQWIASHSPAELMTALDIREPAERDAFIKALKAYPYSFSRDGRFSTRQLADTDIFFRAATPEAGNFSVADMVNDRWAGRAE
ncbi:MAG: ABC transporter substrate-binding protein [Sulfurisoma sp.]|nr:ABC transporter substrate-binding protein [Sulfurisoma sp.]